MNIRTHSEAETLTWAEKYAATLHGGEVLLLRGDLGAGKTVFVRGLARALGYDRAVRSPTFTLLNIYKTKHPTIRRLVHLDLYRLAEAPLETIGLEEWLNDPETVLAIEWPTAELVLASDLVVRQLSFRRLSETEREIVAV